MQRPSWDQYFADITRLVATRSTCMRAQHGCVIVKDKHILTTGYNGSPPGTYHCHEVQACLRQTMNIPSGQQYEKCRSVHAEQNAILQAAKLGIPLKGGVAYVTDVPCEICAKLLTSLELTAIIMVRDSKRYDSKALHDFTLMGGIVKFLKES